jgi:two-component system chemotaxis sensor kinase CheA
MSEDLLPYFLEEGRELAERASLALDDLARGVAPAEALEQAFRALHTLKGSAALFDMAELTALLHAAEGALEPARRGGALEAERLAQLAAALEEIEAWLAALEASPAAPPERRRAAAALEARLRDAPAPAPASAAAPPDWARRLARPAGACVAVRYAPDSEAYFRGEDPLALVQSIPDLQWLGLAVTAEPADAPFTCDLVLTALSGAPREAVAAALRMAGDQAEIVALGPPAAPAPPRDAAQRSVRVESASLDALAERLDQLVLAKNALAHEIALAGAAPGVARTQLALERAVAPLHEAVARLRLAPLRRLFAPLPRQVRDMAAELGKDAQLTLSGEDVAVDKAILDGLYEPLIHVLRNAVDHGLEAPDARRAAGKPAQGRIALSATPRGDAVEIEVADDGAGLDLARIRATAIARGVIGADAALDDKQTAELIFAPGFSTARQVTEMSGRGVGLHAVRAALARLGGRVEIESEAGQGTRLRMIAPMRTLLTRVAILCVGVERFAVPLRSIQEVVRIALAEVLPARQGEAVMVREEVIPLMRLADLVSLPRGRVDPATLLLAPTAEGRIAIACDAVADVILAPVQAAPPLLAAVKGVTGSLVEGDGRVLLVLDLAELAA